MATSGTIGQTVFNTRRVIDTAFRNCKLPAQAITGELIETAKDKLFLMLSAWSTAGVPLWCQTRYILPLYLGQFSVPLPQGTVDVLNANLRELHRLTGNPTSPSGDPALAFDGDLATETVLLAPAEFIQLELETAALVTTVGILPGATGTWNIQLQHSPDGATWTTFYANTALAVTDREWLWLDFEELPDDLFWRILAGVATTLEVRELVFANTPSEITMARINKDDYFSLPNKVFKGRPVQFWMDRQRDLIYMKIWPAADVASQFRQITVLSHRHIMDVGTMQQEIEVPQRWYQALCWNLALEVGLSTPEVKRDVIQDVRLEASKWLTMAWAEERDNSPMQLVVDISPYTQ